MAHLTVNAEELIHMTEDDVWDMLDIPDTPATIKCNDGEVTTSCRALIFTWYIMKFHRSFPALRPSVNHVFGCDSINGGKIVKMMNAIVWEIFRLTDGAWTPTELAEWMVVINSEIYNAHVSRMSAYVVTINIIDAIQIEDDALVQEPLSKHKEKHIQTVTQDDIDEVYDGVQASITKPEYRENSLFKLNAAGTLKKGQVNQFIGARGFLTDVNSRIFKYPILNSYVTGMDHDYELLMDRRAAAKALVMNDVPLQQVEYLNRRIQLVAAYVQTIIRGKGTQLYDCGSDRYVDFRVTERNLDTTKGMYILDPDTNTEVMYTGQEKYLNTTVKMRTALTCKHRHEGRVCGKCYGHLAWSIDVQANLGHQSTMVICPQAAQNVLSTKHLDSIAGSYKILLPESVAGYLEVSPDKTGVRWCGAFKGKARISIKKSSMPNPGDLFRIKDINNIKLADYSLLDNIRLELESSPGVTSSVTLKTAIKSTPAFFTRAFLEHIRKVGIVTDERDRYVIDLKGWNWKANFITYPRRHSNMLDFMSELADLLESSGKDNPHKLSNAADESEALNMVYNLISTVFNSHITHIATLVLAYMVRVPDGIDSSIPRFDEPAKWDNAKSNTLSGRSMSTKLVYEQQTDTLTNFASFTVRKRMSCSMDWVIR